MSASDKRFKNADLIVHNIALSDTAGHADFHYCANNPGFSGLRPRFLEQSKVSKVRTAMLDDAIEPNQRVDLIKVDVEGAELKVFRGGVRIIRRWRPIILFEHGLGGADLYGTDPKDIFELLVDECGLEISLLNVHLKGGSALTKTQFAEQFYNKTNFFFIAYPPYRR